MKAESPAAGASKKSGQDLTLPEFSQGQVWKTSTGYVVISSVGKALIHYRLGLVAELRAGRVRVTTKEEVRAYLNEIMGPFSTARTN